jgi:hypothetical protein
MGKFMGKPRTAAGLAAPPYHSGGSGSPALPQRRVWQPRPTTAAGLAAPPYHSGGSGYLTAPFNPTFPKTPDSDFPRTTPEI